MIESLRGSDRDLSLFAVCAYLAGFFVTVIVRWFHTTTAVVLAATAIPLQSDAQSFEIKAAVLASRISWCNMLLMFISFGVLAIVSYKQPSGGNVGAVGLFARTLYILSFVAMIGAVSTAVFFSICKQ